MINTRPVQISIFFMSLWKNGSVLVLFFTVTLLLAGCSHTNPYKNIEPSRATNKTEKHLIPQWVKVEESSTKSESVNTNTTAKSTQEESKQLGSKISLPNPRSDADFVHFFQTPLIAELNQADSFRLALIKSAMDINSEKSFFNSAVAAITPVLLFDLVTSNSPSKDPALASLFVGTAAYNYLSARPSDLDVRYYDAIGSLTCSMIEQSQYLYSKDEINSWMKSTNVLDSTYIKVFLKGKKEKSFDYYASERYSKALGAKCAEGEPSDCLTTQVTDLENTIHRYQDAVAALIQKPAPTIAHKQSPCAIEGEDCEHRRKLLGKTSGGSGAKSQKLSDVAEKQVSLAQKKLSELKNLINNIQYRSALVLRADTQAIMLRLSKDLQIKELKSPKAAIASFSQEIQDSMDVLTAELKDVKEKVAKAQGAVSNTSEQSMNFFETLPVSNKVGADVLNAERDLYLQITYTQRILDAHKSKYEEVQKLKILLQCNAISIRTNSNKNANTLISSERGL